eukprot:909762_1
MYAHVRKKKAVNVFEEEKKQAFLAAIAWLQQSIESACNKFRTNEPKFSNMYNHHRDNSHNQMNHINSMMNNEHSIVPIAILLHQNPNTLRHLRRKQNKNENAFQSDMHRLVL